MDDQHSSAVDSALIALLSAKQVPAPAGTQFEEVLQRARVHGVGPLLWTGWPNEAPPPAGLREAALAFAAWDMQHHTVLGSALSALAKADTPALVFKGTALAYQLYADSSLRVRADTDLLVPRAAKKQVEEALRRAGFDPVPQVPSYQTTFIRAGEDGTQHSLDVHWRINNSELLSATFSFEELWERSLPLPKFAANARGPSFVDSLLIACLHRATHRHNPYHVDGDAHLEPDRLIWLYDIHLLARRLTHADWELAGRLAEDKGLRGTVMEGLARARKSFDTQLPRQIEEWRTPRGREAPFRYLASGAIRRAWMDILAMPNWPTRLSWVRSTCLPPADYMRARYPASNGRCMPCLYARRLFTGAWKRLASTQGA